MKKIVVLIMMIALAVAITPKEARADSITYDLNYTKVPEFGDPSYGTVKLELISNTIKFTIDRLTDMASASLMAAATVHFRLTGPSVVPSRWAVSATPISLQVLLV
jgi:hypothetical protein